MTWKSRTPSPQLEALLDRRDHLRLKINQAESRGNLAEHELAEPRSELLLLDRKIMRQWGDPEI